MALAGHAATVTIGMANVDHTPKAMPPSMPRGKKCTTTFNAAEANTKRDIKVAPPVS
jgi:hypothetical protein